MEGFVGGLVPFAIGVGIVVAVFPWWRRHAMQKPGAYTWGQPELLADDRPMHPGDPTSNVHTVD